METMKKLGRFISRLSQRGDESRVNNCCYKSDDEMDVKEGLVRYKGRKGSFIVRQSWSLITSGLFSHYYSNDSKLFLRVHCAENPHNNVILPFLLLHTSHICCKRIMWYYSRLIIFIWQLWDTTEIIVQ